MADQSIVVLGVVQQMLNVGVLRSLGCVGRKVGRADPTGALGGHILQCLEMAAVTDVVGCDDFLDSNRIAGTAAGLHHACHTVQRVHSLLQGLAGMFFQQAYCHQAVGGLRRQGLPFVLLNRPPGLPEDGTGGDHGK